MNKHQEVLDYLEGGNLFGELSNESLEEMENIIAKETPMKPVFTKTYDWVCGSCKSMNIRDYENFANYKYCGECGQAIDWSDEDE